MYQKKRQRMEKELSKLSKEMKAPSLIIDGLCQELGEVLQVTKWLFLIWQ